MIIETDRLTLAELQIEDAPFILELYNDPDFIKYIGDRNIHSIFDAESSLKSAHKPVITKMTTAFTKYH